MKFFDQKCPEVKDDIQSGSLTMIGNGNDIKNYCDSNRKIAISPSAVTHRICHINNANSVEYKYENNSIMVYSHTFKWQNALSVHTDRLTAEKTKIMIKNPGVAYPFSGQGSFPKQLNKSLCTFDRRFPVPFPQKEAMLTENNCVWLSTACLVYQIDTSDCEEMIFYSMNPRKTLSGYI